MNKEAEMARRERWRNEDRRYRDDDSRDWRSKGDDWRRGERWRGMRSGEGSWSDYGRGRDFDEPGPLLDRDYGALRESGRRDIGGYDRPDREDYGFARSPGGRPGGVYGPGTYGSAASRYDRDFDWNRDEGGFYERGPYRGYASGWQDEGWSRGRGQERGQERGFLERASDEVASWFGDRQAERRREEDQFRGRGPKGYTRSDDRIREDVSDRLTDDPFVDASEIEVMVSGSEVTLTGFVASREQRRRAEDAAERVSGVVHVQNNIRIHSPYGTGGGPASDANLGQSAFGRDTSTGATGAGPTGSGQTSGAMSAGTRKSSGSL
jgi:osmotically-inducible protein OsmY